MLIGHDHWCLGKQCIFMKSLFRFFIKAVPDVETKKMYGTGMTTNALDNTTAVA